MALVILAGGFYGCGDSEPGGSSTGAVKADYTVIVKNYEFVPKDLTIKPGQTVEWVFQQGTHDVVSGTKSGDVCTGDGKFKSELQSTGTYRFKFDSAGSYPYFCTPHCADPYNQTGTIVVAP